MFRYTAIKHLDKLALYPWLRYKCDSLGLKSTSLQALLERCYKRRHEIPDKYICVEVTNTLKPVPVDCIPDGTTIEEAKNIVAKFISERFIYFSKDLDEIYGECASDEYGDLCGCDSYCYDYSIMYSDIVFRDQERVLIDDFETRPGRADVVYTVKDPIEHSMLGIVPVRELKDKEFKRDSSGTFCAYYLYGYVNNGSGGKAFCDLAYPFGFVPAKLLKIFQGPLSLEEISRLE